MHLQKQWRRNMAEFAHYSAEAVGTVTLLVQRMPVF